VFEGSSGGIDKFKEELVRRIDLGDFEWKTFRLVLVFVVEKDGTLGEVKLEKSSGMKEFDDAIIDGIKELKRNGLPRKWAVLL
jgi:hypothetical protein